MGKIKFSDPVEVILGEMSEGNIGPLNVLIELIKLNDTLDPGGSLTGILIVLTLDDFEIYGPHIWVLYKDVCGQDIKKLVALVAACKLDILSPDKLREMSFRERKSETDNFDIDELYQKVKEKLPQIKF
jgi:hypothetical protein